MSIKQTFVSGLVAVALVAGAIVPSTAGAQSVSDLQAQIAALMAQINALSGSTPASACSYVFTRDLSQGSTGVDVMNLQKVLNASADTQVAVTGAGSKGMETSTFGPATAAAVAKFQVKYGISGTSYVGPITRAKLNTMCSTPVVVTPTPSTPSTGLQGGAGDVSITLRSSGVQDEVLEGQEDVKVLGFDVEAEGSDVKVTSVKIELTHTGATGSDRLDRYVDEVSVWFDGKVVGSAEADDFSESSDVYSRSISLSNVVIDEDDTERLYVSVSAVGNIDSTDLSTNWDVELDHMRFTDATGAILTETPAADAIDQTFTFESLSTSGDIELTITENDQEVNDVHTVIVDDTSDTNDVEILSFTLSAEGSDIALDTLSFGITGSGAGVTEIANDFRLLMDGDEVGTVTIDVDCDGGSDGFASTSDTAICMVVSDLDDDSVVIEEDEEVDFTVVADINDIEGAFTSGDDLSVTINGDVTLSSNGHVIADDENGDTLTISELSGSADSTTIEFLSAGIVVSTVSTSATVDPVQSDVATDDLGIFTVVFDVTAVEDTAFVELGTATRGTSESNTGVNFVIQDADNSYTATTTGAISLADVTRVSGGSMSGEFVQINAGQTARFQLQVSFDPAHTTGEAEGYRMYMYSVNTASTAANADAQQVLTPEVDYRTGAKAIGN